MGSHLEGRIEWLIRHRGVPRAPRKKAVQYAKWSSGIKAVARINILVWLMPGKNTLAVRSAARGWPGP